MSTYCLFKTRLDPYGDHFFTCKQFPKTSIHNRMRDLLYSIISQISLHANLTASNTDTTFEPTGLLPFFPTLRPANISLQTIAGSFHYPISNLLIDLTILPMPHDLSRTDDSYKHSVVRLQEKHENG
jgi:hypothetical protein